MSFINQVILNKKVMIKIDDYSSFHKMHRWSEYCEMSHYISLYFFYHYVPYWRENQKSKLERMLDSDIKVLGLWDGGYGLNPDCVEQLDNLQKISQMKTSDFEKYDVILNMLDSEIHSKSATSKIGLESKIASGEIVLRPDQIYIGFKSSNAPKIDYSFYNMKLAQSFSQVDDCKDPLILKDVTGKNSHHNFRIQYGPWPLDYLDMKTFSPWKKRD